MIACAHIHMNNLSLPPTLAVPCIPHPHAYLTTDSFVEHQLCAVTLYSINGAQSTGQYHILDAATAEGVTTFHWYHRLGEHVLAYRTHQGWRLTDELGQLSWHGRGDGTAEELNTEAISSRHVSELHKPGLYTYIMLVCFNNALLGENTNTTYKHESHIAIQQ